MASVTRLLGRMAQPLTRGGPMTTTPIRQFTNSTPKSKAPPPRPKPRRPADYPPMPEYSPDLLNEEERSMYELMTPEDRAAFDAENRRAIEAFNDPAQRGEAFAEIDRLHNKVERETPLRIMNPPKKRLGFWGDDEVDEFGQVEDADEGGEQDDEMMSTAHAEVEVHRENREYARIAAWDMPLLSQHAKPFQLPPSTHILRFRYTNYMGEQHPAEPKVVVELATADLVPNHLTQQQRLTLQKLAGPRYNHRSDILRISCESFPERAQNKRYLADLVNSLICEAKEGDSFADIPLDTRHVKTKPVPKFPGRWLMTEKNKRQLEARRRERAEKTEREKRPVIDGNAVVAQAVKSLPSLNPGLAAQAAEDRDKVAVRVGAARPKRIA